jgi:hypothetical protein
MTINQYSREHHDELKQIIDRFGCSAEHNINWFEYITDEGQTPFYLLWPDSTAILAHKEDRAWYFLMDPLAPDDMKVPRLLEAFSEVLLDSKVDKIVVELTTNLRKILLSSSPESLIARNINYTLVWPVYNMSVYDSSLPGKSWKSLRNARNTFYREHKVDVQDAKDISSGDLHDLVSRWKKVRAGSDRTFDTRYHAAIDYGFKGFDSVRALIVDDKVSGINGGWPFPNKKDFYYGAVGLHDYSHKDLGHILYLEDLDWIKNAGYKYADMAGGEKELTHYKNLFHPEYWYKTHIFSICRA